MISARLSARALALVAAMAVASGCGNSTASSDDAATPVEPGRPVTTATSAPAKGDVDQVRWALFYEPTTLNWTQAYAVSENTALANLCESLLVQDPDFSIRPALAESATNPTPLKWVYRIRDGVRFWNGRPLTAEDVVYSLQKATEPTSYWANWFVNVRSIERTAPDEVTVTLKRPDAIFNKMMATAAGVVVEKAYATEKGDAYGTPDGGVMCTGPFRLDRWNKGDSIVMTRNDGYWDPSRRAHAKTLELRFVPDESTLTSALQSGDIDGTFSAPLSGVEQLRSSQAGTLTLGKSAVFDTIAFSAEKGPLADARVRRALSLAIDRDAIARTVFSGTAQPVKSPAVPSTWGYERAAFAQAYEALPSMGPDLDQAKSLIAEAGSPKEPVTLALPGDVAAFVQIGTIVQDAAKKIGLKMELRPIATSAYIALFTDAKAREGIDGLLGIWYPDVAEPLNIFAQVTDSQNFNGYANPEVRAALDRARGTYDDAERAQLAIVAQRQLMEDMPWAPLVNRSELVFMNKRITGAPVSSLAQLYTPWGAGIGAAG